jgi:hypothetical protein
LWHIQPGGIRPSLARVFGILARVWVWFKVRVKVRVRVRVRDKVRVKIITGADPWWGSGCNPSPAIGFQKIMSLKFNFLGVRILLYWNDKTI